MKLIQGTGKVGTLNLKDFDFTEDIKRLREYAKQLKKQNPEIFIEKNQPDNQEQNDHVEDSIEPIDILQSNIDKEVDLTQTYLDSQNIVTTSQDVGYVDVSDLFQKIQKRMDEHFRDTDTDNNKNIVRNLSLTEEQQQQTLQNQQSSSLQSLQLPANRVSDSQQAPGITKSISECNTQTNYNSQNGQFLHESFQSNSAPNQLSVSPGKNSQIANNFGLDQGNIQNISSQRATMNNVEGDKTHVQNNDTNWQTPHSQKVSKNSASNLPYMLALSSGQSLPTKAFDQMNQGGSSLRQTRSLNVDAIDYVQQQRDLQEINRSIQLAQNSPFSTQIFDSQSTDLKRKNDRDDSVFKKPPPKKIKPIPQEQETSFPASSICPPSTLQDSESGKDAQARDKDQMFDLYEDMQQEGDFLHLFDGSEDAQNAPNVAQPSLDVYQSKTQTQSEDLEDIKNQQNAQNKPAKVEFGLLATLNEWKSNNPDKAYTVRSQRPNSTRNTNQHKQQFQSARQTFQSQVPNVQPVISFKHQQNKHSQNAQQQGARRKQGATQTRKKGGKATGCKKVSTFSNVCRFWSFGKKCSRGDDCPYSHEQPPITTLLSCYSFLKGGCSMGIACPYNHDPKHVPPCKQMVVNGNCNLNNCQYSHEPLSDDVRNELKRYFLWSDKQKFDKEQKIIGNGS
eukprot:TRINITY_DN2737_c0_g1_i5.p1 TRINITY_DN2737_c0_g1~~TRINITY_DN2737_c0_g1_i5.p1  ORF type:complete len:760 (-),score=57.50 TRINITY_DN2737_c0_g1_i5:1107-3131(-)